MYKKISTLYRQIQNTLPNKNNNINFITRVGIKNIISYTPQIIDTNTIGNNNISEIINSYNSVTGSTNNYVLNPKTVNIIYIDKDNSPHLQDLIDNDKHIYIRLKLPDAS